MNQLHSAPPPVSCTLPYAVERHRRSSSLSVVFNWVRDRLGLLWREDPRVAVVLTPSFLKEFKTEFDRMVRERQEGLAQSDRQLCLLSLMHADSWDSRHRLFDVLVEQYPRLRALPPLLRAEALLKLMQHCELPASGLI